jgi:hypothetical protein
LDPVKRRLVQFSEKGRWLEAATGVNEIANDIVPDGEDLLIIENEPEGIRDRLHGDRLIPLPADNVTLPDGTPDNPYSWAATPQGLAAWTFSGLHPLLNNGRVDRTVEGAPLGSGQWLSIQAQREDRFLIRHGNDWAEVLDFGNHADEPKLTVSMSALTVTTDGRIHLWADIGELSGPHPRHGSFYLRLSASGRLEIAEHVQDTSDEGVQSANQKRAMSVAPDGGVWQLILTERGAELRRRS